MTEFLIQNGIDVNATDDVGSNALHRAAEHDNVKVGEMLLKHGIDMNFKDVYGCTPLHRAAEHSKRF